jgi:hypothetical protein
MVSIDKPIRVIMMYTFQFYSLFSLSIKIFCTFQFYSIDKPIRVKWMYKKKMTL